MKKSIVKELRFFVKYEDCFQRRKFLGCRDPRWKHEYLDNDQVWITTGEEELDESDKHI